MLEEVRRIVSAANDPGLNTTGQAGSPSGQSSLIGGLIETNGISSRFTRPDRGERMATLWMPRHCLRESLCRRHWVP